MSPEDLKALLSRRPFLPFRLHITGGVTYDITFPEAALLSRSVLVIGVKRDVKSEFFDEPNGVALRHIIQAEPIVEDAPA
jgi:hypothetical protein